MPLGGFMQQPLEKQDILCGFDLLQLIHLNWDFET